MYNLTDDNPHHYVTPDQASNAPSYVEFDVLTENDFLELVQDATHLRSEKKVLESQIKDTDLSIMSLMAALPVKSVTCGPALITFVDTTEAKTLDKKALKQNLVKYGVPIDEVNRIFEASTKTSQRSASIRIMDRSSKDSLSDEE